MAPVFLSEKLEPLLFLLYQRVMNFEKRDIGVIRMDVAPYKRVRFSSKLMLLVISLTPARYPSSGTSQEIIGIGR